MMSLVTRTFFKGLAVILPITVTAYVLYWLASSAEAALGAAIRLVLPEAYYVPGMGVVAGLLLVFGVGVLMNLWLTRKVVRQAEEILERIPLVKTLYGSVRDLMGYFSSGEQKERLEQVVLVEFAGTATHLLGFLTRDDLEDLSAGFGESDKVAVYLPMSYQIGGFTVMVPRSSVTPVDMSVEEGMRFAMTAGVSKGGARS